MFLFSSFTLSDVDHSNHKFNEMAGRAQNRMTDDVNLSSRGRRGRSRSEPSARPHDFICCNDYPRNESNERSLNERL
jgi:hypothetical protein